MEAAPVQPSPRQRAIVDGERADVIADVWDMMDQSDRLKYLSYVIMYVWRKKHEKRRADSMKSN
jgi:hypothetical protein